MKNLMYILYFLQLLAVFSQWNHICLYCPNAAHPCGMCGYMCPESYYIYTYVCDSAVWITCCLSSHLTLSA